MDQLHRCADCLAPLVLYKDGSIRCLECKQLATVRPAIKATRGWSYRQTAGSPRGQIVLEEPRD